MKRARLFRMTKDLTRTHWRRGRPINVHDAVLGLVLCIGHLGVQCWVSNWWVFVIGRHINGATCKQVRPFHPFGEGPCFRRWLASLLAPLRKCRPWRVGNRCWDVSPSWLVHGRVMLAIVDCEVEEMRVGISTSQAAGVKVIRHMSCVEFTLVDETLRYIARRGVTHLILVSDDLREPTAFLEHRTC